VSDHIRTFTANYFATLASIGELAIDLNLLPLQKGEAMDLMFSCFHDFLGTF